VSDFDLAVEHLGIRHRAKNARWTLMFGRSDAVPALKRGLAHENPDVRAGCCIVLDHHLEEDCLPDLIANLEHADDNVRRWALHALACDRCKEGSCRPGEADVVPVVARMLVEDPSTIVRAQAAGLLGEAVHRHPDALPAIQRALETETSPGIPKILGWHVPGGPRFERTKPKPARISSH
jgi:hypothetical protein